MDHDDSLERALNHFKKCEAPNLLIELLEFDLNCPRDFFCTSFEFYSARDIERFSSEVICGYSNDSKEFDSRLLPFATNDGCGSCLALWRPQESVKFGDSPIAELDSEGEVRIIASNFYEFLSLLLTDTHYYDDEMAHNENESPNHHLFRQWFEEKGIRKIQARSVLKTARDKYHKDFQLWFSNFHPDLYYDSL